VAYNIRGKNPESVRIVFVLDQEIGRNFLVILDFTLKLLAYFGVVVNCMTGHHTPLTYIPQKQGFEKSLREKNGR